MTTSEKLKEFAGRLDGGKFTGNEYADGVSIHDIRYAKDNGIVIVFGAYDDLVEFRGAIDDESRCYGTGTIYLDRSGEMRSQCLEDDCPYFCKIRDAASKIKAIWGSEGYSWIYETDIPHETFDIFEDGEKYCRGIVFSIDNVR